MGKIWFYMMSIGIVGSIITNNLGDLNKVILVGGSTRIPMVIDKLEKYIGKTVSILTERLTKEGLWEGHTSNFIQVFAKGECTEGKLISVKLTGYNEEYMTGEIVC